MKKNFMCFIYVYLWNRKMDNPVYATKIIFCNLCKFTYISEKACE